MTDANQITGSQGTNPLRTLRKLVPKAPPIECCEFCSSTLHPNHAHMIEPGVRRLLCACGSCALFAGNRRETRYKLISSQVRSLPGFKLTEAQWDDLALPIGMAFFFYSGPEERIVAVYPSPAGPTESTLSLEAWEEIKRDNPALEKMEPDVEALLVNRLDRAHEYFVLPIDECYRLVGIIRTNWRGLSGGKEMKRELETFFVELRKRCVPLSAPSEDASAQVQGEANA